MRRGQASGQGEPNRLLFKAKCLTFCTIFEKRIPHDIHFHVDAVRDFFMDVTSYLDRLEIWNNKWKYVQKPACRIVALLLQ